MATATLECPTIQRARRSTEETSRAVDEWKERRDKVCAGLDGLLTTAIKMVGAWKDAGDLLGVAAAENRITDYIKIGDFVHPYVVVSNDLLQGLVGLIEASSDLQCPLPNHTDFRIAVFEMGRIAHYFENWPRSNSEQVAKIREEFARGEYRDFQEFLREMQTRGHSAG